MGDVYFWLLLIAVFIGAVGISKLLAKKRTEGLRVWSQREAP